MSYLDKGKEYEEKYLQGIKDDPEEGCIFPCFSESCYDELLQERVSRRVDEAFEISERILSGDDDEEGGDLGVIGLVSVFGQYLADTYGVEPADVEYMCHLVFDGLTNAVVDAAGHAIDMITGEAEAPYRVEPKKPGLSKVIKMDFGNRNKGKD